MRHVWRMRHRLAILGLWGCQMTAEGTEKSQQCHKYFVQYSKFAAERPQVRTGGWQTFFLPRAPSDLVTPLLICTEMHTPSIFGKPLQPFLDWVSRVCYRPDNRAGHGTASLRCDCKSPAFRAACASAKSCRRISPSVFRPERFLISFLSHQRGTSHSILRLS